MMETIRVNMTPCEDIKTIHASQNDNEAREWGFELHNNGEKIDSSSISDQLVFKAYEGGTEEILPTNGSTPTTSPFKGDIKYPQGLLSDQEFLYRESPTEEDGLAKITNIKGNTLVWNQLIASNETVNLNRDSARTYNISVNNTRSVVGHKYCFATTITSDNTSGGLNCRFGSDFNAGKGVGRHSTIFTANDTNNASIYCYIQSNEESGTAISFKDSVFFDLTLMFGQGNEPTSVSEFTSLFPLPYYDYNQGTLLSFMGNGIKTVGKNLLPTDLRMTNLYGLNADKSIYQFNTSSAPFTWSYENSAFRVTLPSGQYKVGFIAKTKSTSISSGLILTDSDNNFIVTRGGSLNNLERGEYSFSLTKTTDLGLCVKVYDGVWWLYIIDAENEMATYEPYTSSTLSLPISTYFPTGMKSAGSVYDELTPSNAITRIGAVDLGSLTWTYDSSVPRFYTTDINTLIKKPANNYVEANAVSSMYVSTTFDKLYTTEKKNMTMAFGATGTFNVMNTSYSDANAFKTAMSGVYLYYELATPTETSFKTATLVTENGEVALANENGVLVGRCNSDISADAGFIEGKIKLSDEDGDVYSNKIQIHVERKPS